MLYGSYLLHHLSYLNRCCVVSTNSSCGTFLPMRPYASLSRKFLTRQSLDIAIVNLAKEAGTGNLVDIYLLRPRRDSRQLLLTGQLLLPRISAIRKKLLFPLGDFISRRTRFSCATMFERKATAAVTRFERQRLVLNLLIMSSRLPVLLSLQLPF